MVGTVAGDYGKFKRIILKDLIKLIDLNHFVYSRSIHELLYNARVRAKMLSNQRKENGHLIDTFQYKKDVALDLLRD